MLALWRAAFLLALVTLGTLLVGIETIQTTGFTVNIQTMAAQQLECTVSGTLEEVHIRVPGAGNQKAPVWAMIFAENAGSPGTLLGKGEIKAEQIKETWYGVKLTAGVAVTSGTKYWLGALSPASSTVALRLTGTGSGSNVTFKISTKETFKEEPAETSEWTGSPHGPVSIYGTGTGTGGTAGHVAMVV